MKPNCYECRHRRDVPGDAHSECVHPDVHGKNTFLALVRVAKYGEAYVGDLHVKGARHGIDGSRSQVWLL